MKKIFILVLVALSLTACGSKGNKVVCTDDEGKITLGADKDGKIDAMSIERKAEGVDKENFEQGKAMFDAIAPELEKKGITTSLTHSGDTVTIKLDMDMKNFKAEDLEEIGFGLDLDNNFKLDDAVKSFETQGFTCK